MNTPHSVVRTCTRSLLALVATTGATLARPGNELETLTPNGGKLGDAFGSAVAVDGAMLVVGAPNDDTLMFNSGAAFLFDLNTRKQLRKWVMGDGFTNPNFGSSVGISGTTVVVGAPRADVAGPDSGAAYLFDTTTGQQIAEVVSDDLQAQDDFGRAVAIAGGLVVVGANGHDGRGLDAGAAYLFDATTGVQLAELVPGDIAAGDEFGMAVAIRGDRVVVGAPRHDANGQDSGAAYVFDANTGHQIAKLQPLDPAPFDQFGYAVATDGVSIVVGARLGKGVVEFSGTAFVFDAATGVQHAKLLADDGDGIDRFASAIAVHGSKVLLGAEQDTTGGGSGSAYVFDTTTGQQLDKLRLKVPTPLTFLGSSVALQGTTAIVGADSNGLLSSPGAVHLFSAVPLSLLGDSETVSVFSGGQQVLDLDAEDIRAGWFYFLFGSASGSFPGLDLGDELVLPLNVDAYFGLTLKKPGLAAFGDFRGVLDGEGKARATLTLPPIADLSLAGVELRHAYLAASVLGVPEFASNAVKLTLVP